MISVIIPIYNAQDYLGRCINSVLSQTYRDIEVLLVDDGSTDKSGDMCDTFQMLDARVKVFHIQNGGPSAARNYALDKVKGQWVMFVDADDWLYHDALEHLSHRWDNSDMVVGDFTISGRPARFLCNDDYHMISGDLVAYLTAYLKRPSGYSMFVYVWGRLFKTAIIRNYNLYFNEQLRIFEDSLFLMDYLKHCSSVQYVRKYVYNFYVNQHPSSERNIYADPLRFKTATSAVCYYLISRGVNTIPLAGQANVSFAIRQMVRYFDLDMEADKERVKQLIKLIVLDDDIQRGLTYYQPTKGDSKIIPFLMKRKLITPLMWACKRRAKK
jgi:glycosyltransferase involved in cell wall biosynthesis